MGDTELFADRTLSHACTLAKYCNMWQKQCSVEHVLCLPLGNELPPHGAVFD